MQNTAWENTRENLADYFETLPIHPDKSTMCVFIQLLHHKQDVIQTQFIKRSTASLNTVFTFSNSAWITKTKEPSLPNYLPLDGRRTRVIELSET